MLTSTLDFLPEHIFDTIYKPIMKDVKVDYLMWKIESEFITMARQSAKSGIPSSQLHLDTIREFQHYWLTTSNKAFCTICIARSSRYRLTCDHQICDVCAVIFQMDATELTIEIPKCPLCLKPNQVTFYPVPATASRRTLSISGSSSQNIVRYLKDLQVLLGLTAWPLRNQFDEVIASDHGME